MPKQIKTIVGTIEDFVFVSQGKKKDGTPWALYKGFITGEKFQTFDEEYVKNSGVKKRFLYEEEPGEFTNKETGKLIKYTRRTLLPYKTAKDHEEDNFEQAQKEIPIIEEEPEEPEEYEVPGLDAKPEEMEALTKSDKSMVQKIYDTQTTILTELEEINKKLGIE